jgi:hypothetical protein
LNREGIPCLHSRRRSKDAANNLVHECGYCTSLAAQLPCTTSVAARRRPEPRDTHRCRSFQGGDEIPDCCATAGSLLGAATNCLLSTAFFFKLELLQRCMNAGGRRELINSRRSTTRRASESRTSTRETKTIQFLQKPRNSFGDTCVVWLAKAGTVVPHTTWQRLAFGLER